MNFTLYTEKTVAQCMSALSERIEAKAALVGWVEKGGTFALGTTTRVLGIPRRTMMRGKFERHEQITQIRGAVGQGVPLHNQWFVFVALVIVGMVAFTNNLLVVTVGMLPIALALYVVMNGDRVNSEQLLGELQRTLKARSTPPKREDAPTARTTKAKVGRRS